MAVSAAIPFSRGLIRRQQQQHLAGVASSSGGGAQGLGPRAIDVLAYPRVIVPPAFGSSSFSRIRKHDCLMPEKLVHS